MLEFDVHAAVANVCPINGVSFGRLDDPNTWRVDFKPDALPEQRAAAQNVIATFDVLAAEKARLLISIDAEAERQRLLHITPGSGMALTYQEKFQQAQAVIAMGSDAANALSETDRIARFPTLAASVGVEAQTLADVADLVVARYARFAQLSYFIEHARLSGKAAVQAATTADEVKAAYAAITWTLP